MFKSVVFQCSRITELAAARPFTAHYLISSFTTRYCSSDSHSKNHVCVQGKTNNISRTGLVRISPLLINSRRVSVYNPLHQEAKDSEKEEEVVNDDSEDAGKDRREAAPQLVKGNVPRHSNKDRQKHVPVETSMRYLKSRAYAETYGDNPVWVLYRRNFPGQFAPVRTRKTCIRGGLLSTGNPCPICRDEYLVIDYQNVDLLKQFISPYNGEILGYSKTGVCRQKHDQLIMAIEKAKDYGLITFDVPFREYDYKEYEKIYSEYQR